MTSTLSSAAESLATLDDRSIERDASLDQVVSRRALLGRAGRNSAGLGGMGLLGSLLAGAGVTGLASAAGAAEPSISADVDPRSLLPKLVARLTFGPNATELAKANRLGYTKYLNDQLNRTSVGGDLSGRLGALSLLGKTAAQIYSMRGPNRDPDQRAIEQLQMAAVFRAIYSQRQLYERVVEMWTDHFNIVGEDWLRPLKLVDDREVIRKFALRKFPDLLRASATSPAMMIYLNNDQSDAYHPNENYAREIMELHTLSVTGGYTHDDIIALAKILSGWGIYYEWEKKAGNKRGTFRFNPDRHNKQDKIFLGNVIPGQAGAAGFQEGLQALKILADHPATARFIATKICRKFLADQPQAAWIDAVAATYTSTGGDIKSMIRTALTPEFLADAPLRLKRPMHLIASAIRGVQPKVKPSNDLIWQLEQMGHDPFHWHPPNGYPDRAAYWAGNQLPRWNFGTGMPFGDVSGVDVKYNEVFKKITTTQTLVAKINTMLFQGAMPQSLIDDLTEFVGNQATNQQRQAEAIGLAISSPAYQWY